MSEASDNAGKGNDRLPVSVLFDEFANIGSIPDFTRSISTLRSRKIYIMIILQSFDDVLEVMDNYGKPYYGHNYTKESEDQAGSGSGILSYLTTDGYKIEFYFDGYGKRMNSVHIAYVPGELSYREGMARLQSNN